MLKHLKQSQSQNLVSPFYTFKLSISIKNIPTEEGSGPEYKTPNILPLHGHKNYPATEHRRLRRSIASVAPSEKTDYNAATRQQVSFSHRSLTNLPLPDRKRVQPPTIDNTTIIDCKPGSTSTLPDVRPIPTYTDSSNQLTALQQ